MSRALILLGIFSALSAGTAWGFPWCMPSVLMGGWFLGRWLALERGPA